MSLSHLGSDGRVATLLARKAQIEAKLQRERDSLKISALKKEKLMIKDQMVGLSRVAS